MTRKLQMIRTAASETMFSAVVNYFVIPPWYLITISDVLVAIYALTAPCEVILEF